MYAADERLIAILRRDVNGIWQTVPSAETKEGEGIIIHPTEKGLVAILGEPSDEEYREISIILDRIG
jgi:hypothetical protein